MPAPTTAPVLRSRPVFLLGMMGAGKSRIGRELADAGRGVFIDLDARVERMFARSIPALFELGEAYFRACERSALVSLCAEPGFAGSAVVVATGGGVVGDRANLETMAASGELVYLDVGVEALVARLSTHAERARRPLLSGTSEALGERLSALLGTRERLYRQADHRVDAEAAPAEVVAAILEALRS